MNHADASAARATAIINMLASANDGEALNAARILAAKANERGLLMADYLRTLLVALDARAAAPQPAPAQAAPQREARRGLEAHHAETLRRALNHPATSVWERGFAGDVIRRNYPASPAQVRIIESIVATMMRHDEARDAAVVQRERELRERANGRGGYARRAGAEQVEPQDRSAEQARARAAAEANMPKPGDPCPF